MLTLKTDKECDYIVKNVVSACKDINKLTRAGYEFLYLASGFIAHYNRYGFMDYFSQESLAQALKNNAWINQWNNFRPGDKDYDYYMQKKNIYNRILNSI